MPSIGNLLDTQRRDESAGIVAAMVAILPVETPPTDDDVARALLIKGLTPSAIAEHLDTVVAMLKRDEKYI